jgi:ABC-type polysaccharide/polyol phosphate transport system ATPase subunit
MISLRGVTKRYVKYLDTPLLVSGMLSLRNRERREVLTALSRVDLDVEPGECLGVIGRNGSGKSTLLRLLAGVTAPSEGTVAVAGRVAPLISVGVGFHPELTGRENVYVNGTILGRTRREVAARMDEIVAFADLEDFVDTPVKFYSSGMFVRLGFAASVLADPEVLLVDEVLAVGDVAFQNRCFDRMAQLRAQGTTVVIVSHNLAAVRRLCERTVVLHDGSLVHDGDPVEGINRYHDLVFGSGDHTDGDRGVAGAGGGAGAGTGGGGGGVGGAAGAAGASETAVRAVRGRVELLDAAGRPSRRVRAGGELTIRMGVEVRRPVEGIAVNMGVDSTEGQRIYGDTLWDLDHRLEAGTEATLSARFVADLPEGSYLAQLVLADATGAAVCSPGGPIPFHVTGRPQVTGLADLRADIRIDHTGDPVGL